MEMKVLKTDADKIQFFRTLFLHESNFQFIYDKCHKYGWADTYLFTYHKTPVGYGAIWGQEKREDRDAIFEFYVSRPYRKFAGTFFSALIKASNAVFIECQSNDLLLTEMLYTFGKNINAEAILFRDNFQTGFEMNGANLHKPKNDTDNPEYVLHYGGEVVAAGGLMLNYNMPYADIYYEVSEQHRRKGFGSFFVQELKKQAYNSGRIPAARCNIDNAISKATLLKSGFEVCGFILKGEVKH